MWKPNGSNGETLCSHLHIQNTAVFSSGVAAIRAQLGARTPSQLAEVDAIKPMFAVCYLNTLSQGGNHRRRYYTFIINDLSDGFDTAARHADQRCSRRCDYSCALWAAAIRRCQLSSVTRVFFLFFFPWQTGRLNTSLARSQRWSERERENRGNFYRQCWSDGRPRSWKSCNFLHQPIMLVFLYYLEQWRWRVKGERFDVEDMKNAFCCTVPPDKWDWGKSFVYWSTQSSARVLCKNLTFHCAWSH